MFKNLNKVQVQLENDHIFILFCCFSSWDHRKHDRNYIFIPQ